MRFPIAKICLLFIYRELNHLIRKLLSQSLCIMRKSLLGAFREIYFRNHGAWNQGQKSCFILNYFFYDAPCNLFLMINSIPYHRINCSSRRDVTWNHVALYGAIAHLTR